MASNEATAPNNNDTIEIQETEISPVEPAQPFSGLTSLIPMVLIFAVFYFLLLRPQEKRRRQREKLVSDVKKGEEILTNSGIFGTVTKVNDTDNKIEVEIAKDVHIKILKSAVVDITSRTKELPTNKKDNSKGAKNDKKVISAKSS
ncbi:preprotein translocase subunit YajC [Rickettsia endosymbiont of Halotydeus destructor]|uniref:preprotein translocase subunit YajC n=1 Tax=Rickettsia endosymbiont of Halotydeus destructor TaxID=2996754 RepID=UPI003BB0EBE4